MPGLGNRTLLRLVQIFGSAQKVLAAGPQELSLLGGAHDRVLQALASKQFIRDPAAEWRYLEKSGFRMLCRQDEDYPANLAQVPDPPAVLFSCGEVLPRDLASIAIVGSRSASPAGVLFAEKLSADLAACGLTVVSGLALGIDSAAHRGALKARGRTLAVLGCGLDVNYPALNCDLRGQIARTGALVTEFIAATPPSSGNFPTRNRIISGLSLGVVVVEAAERSGSLITARMALEQGREVFAVPGMAQSMRNKGAHQLIRQGAKLVENAEDILEEIRPLIRRNPILPPAGREQTAAGSEAPNSEEQRMLLKSLDSVPKHIDAIATQANLSTQYAAALLLELELKGFVSQLPGKYFIANL